MRRKRNLCFSCATIPTLIFFAQCANDYNPFENYSNAQARFYQDSSTVHFAGDTIPVFSTQRLAVYTVVREKIASFTLHANGNRYWKDTTIRPPFKKEIYCFFVSFYDTGATSLYLTTHTTNGDSSRSPDISVMTVSPLRQKDITQSYGQPCTLSTPAVADKDVYYFWSFISDTIKSPFSNNPDQFPVIAAFNTQQTGRLWVADTSGTHTSPRVSFKFQFNR